MNKELEVHAKAHSQATGALQASEVLYQKAQKEVQHKDWELKNTTAMKDSRLKDICAIKKLDIGHYCLNIITLLLPRIKELDDKLQQMERNYNKDQEAYNRK